MILGMTLWESKYLCLLAYKDAKNLLAVNNSEQRLESANA
jgi:hypothetical protein